MYHYVTTDEGIALINLERWNALYEFKGNFMIILDGGTSFKVNEQSYREIEGILVQGYGEVINADKAEGDGQSVKAEADQERA